MSSMKAHEIQAWLTDYISKLMQIPPEEALLDREFTSFGIDSAAAVGLSVDLGDWLGIEIDPTLVYDHPTIESVSAYIAEKLLAEEPASRTVAA
jgi:acyl carrier protein